MGGEMLKALQRLLCPCVNLQGNRTAWSAALMGFYRTTLPMFVLSKLAPGFCRGCLCSVPGHSSVTLLCGHAWTGGCGSVTVCTHTPCFYRRNHLLSWGRKHKLLRGQGGSLLEFFSGETLILTKVFFLFTTMALHWESLLLPESHRRMQRNPFILFLWKLMQGVGAAEQGRNRKKQNKN